VELKSKMRTDKALQRVIKDSERVIDGWKSMYITAAREVMVAEELVSRFPDDTGFRNKVTSAWKEYRGVCRSAGKLNLPLDVISALPRLIFSQVIPAALDRAR